MPNNIPTANYDMTQQELYSVSETMYGNLSTTDIADFLAHKPLKYVPLFLTDIKGRRLAAFNMPDDDQTSSVHETKRTQLIDFRIKCTDNFGILKSYIDDGFPESLQKTKNDEAGQTLMRDCLKNNWEKVVSLNKKMKDFIAAYPAELTGGFMPGTFAADVDAGILAFNTGYAAFKSTRQTGTSTGGKLTANNLVDDDMKSIQGDAAVIYKYNGEKLKRYTISVIKALVSPPGSASIKVTVKTAADVMIADRDILMKTEGSPEFTIRTNLEGVVTKDNVDPGVYACKIVNTDGTITNVTKEINTGVNARLVVIVPN